MRLYPVDVSGIVLCPEELDELYLQMKKVFITALSPEKITYNTIRHVLSELEEELLNIPLSELWEAKSKKQRSV